ncbi:MAG TPA: mechanosensitive ion channel family protein, partial [Candidatus Bathyarchaeia archaeon]|nr:mechanosensitive ion channel family protein [Candidatus Bathyarchaeia archaeon]
MEELLIQVYEYVIKYGFNILAAVVIFFVGKWAARLISNFVESLFHRSKMDATLATFVKDIVYFGILVFVVIAAVNKL